MKPARPISCGAAAGPTCRSSGVTHVQMPNRDRKIIDALQFDPTLEPDYDALRDMILWWDEFPRNLTPVGHEIMHDVLIARSFLFHHPQLRLPCIALDGVDRRRQVWNEFAAEFPSWPGLRRTRLSAAEQAFYAHWNNIGLEAIA